MKKILVLTTALITASLPAVAADYFVELGAPQTAEGAKAQWESLSKTHKDLLGKLTFYPKTVIGNDGSTLVTIQAGTLPDKNKAQRLCSKLFAKDVSCFVIEGLEKAPTMATGMFRSFGAPAAATTTTQIAVPATNSNAVVTFGGTPVNATKKTEVLGEISAPKPQVKIETSKPEVIIPPAPEKISKPAESRAFVVPKAAPVVLQPEPKPEAPKTEAKVAVAEAIPVPLTGQNTLTAPSAPVVVSAPSAPSFATPPSVVTQDLAPVEFTSGGAGWLTLGKFESEKTANAFWADARARFPELAAGLRVRILRSLTRNSEGLRLNVGPFPNDNAADNFCARVINIIDPQLSCKFERTDAPVKTNVESLPAEPFSRGNRYEQRRRQVEQVRSRSLEQSGRRASEASMTHEQSDKSYWAQVVIADSKSEAASQLEDIRRAHADVLDGITGRISRSSAKNSKFNVRLGPLSNEQAATELCDTLQGRGVDCLVVSTF